MDKAQLQDLITKAAKAYNLDPELLLRMAQAESQFNHGAVSKRGAIGVMQLMPQTAKWLGVDPNDPVQNIDGGARYTRYLLDRYHNPSLAVAAYNAGPDAVDSAGGVPDNGETPAYVHSVLGTPVKTAHAPVPQQPITPQPIQQDVTPNVSAGSPQYVEHAQNPFEHFIEGALGAVNSAGAGLDQLLTELNPLASAQDKQRVKDSMEFQREFESRPQNIYSNAGKLAGNTGLALAMSPSSTLGGQMIGGGAFGLTQPVVDPLENVASAKAGQIGAGVGGALAGHFLGLGASRILRPLPINLTSSEQQALQAAQKLQEQGYPLTLSPADITGSPTLRRLDRTYKGLPFVGGKMQEIANANKASTDRALADAIGVPNSGDLSPQSLAAREAMINKGYSGLYSGKQINFTPQDIWDARNIAMANTDAGDMGNDMLSNVFSNSISRMAKGPMQGDTYQLIRSDLGRKSADLSGSAKTFVGALKGVYDNAANRSLSPDEIALKDQLDQQYQAYQLAKRSVNNGDVSLKVLNNSLRNNATGYDTGAFADKQPILNELGKLSSLQSLPTSQTAENFFAAKALENAGEAIVAPPQTPEEGLNILKYPAMGLVARGLQSATYSPAGKAWLENGLFGVPYDAAGYMSKALAPAGVALTGPSYDADGWWSVDGGKTWNNPAVYAPPSSQ